MALAILALGSNVGDRLRYLRRAVEALAPHLAGLRCSGVYESKAVLPEGAPREWDTAYLNMALGGETALSPEALLAEAKALERALGRTDRGHWGPREIDIDIIALGDTVMETPALTLPHARLCERDFVLLPVAEIAPEWKYPAGGGYHNYTPQGIIEAAGMRVNSALMRTGFRVDEA